MQRDAEALLKGPLWMVDDEAELVSATVAMLGREVGENRVRGTTDAREVERWMELEKPAALITDIRMPHVTGLELVTRLHERWGPVPVVVITAFPTAQVDRDASAGRFAYLPKPFTFRSLRETLLRICTQPAPSAFSGAIAVSMLGEVVQLYGLANRTGVLRVTSPDGDGDIGFESGRVVDARCGNRVGVDAFNTILGWNSGGFVWLSVGSPKTTIQTGLSELLLEAYRLRDEAQAGFSESSNSSDDLFSELEAVAPEHVDMQSNVTSHLTRLERAEGFLGAALFDIEKNACVAAVERDLSVQVRESAINDAVLLRAKQKTISMLELEDELEDIVISLGREYHLLRLCRRQPGLFFYLTLERSKTNLAMARHMLSDVERDIVL